MSQVCLYREGDCWDGAILDECNEQCVAKIVGYDADDAKDAEALTVEHVYKTGMTVITYYNPDGESRNWIFPTNLYSGNVKATDLEISVADLV